MRSCDCPRRTGFDATLACSTAIWGWLIRRQFESRQDLCEEKPGSEPFIDQHRAFAVPADSGLRGMITLQNWTRIDITFLLPAKVAKKSVDLVQFRRDYIMIIVPPCIACDTSMRGPNP